jgi:parvulin-like peptidyl-prolyl isomerase
MSAMRTARNHFVRAFFPPASSLVTLILALHPVHAIASPSNSKSLDGAATNPSTRSQVVNSNQTQSMGTGELNANTLDAVIVTIADEPLLLSELQKAVFLTSQKQTRLTAQGQLVGGQMTAADAETVMDQLINQKILSIRVRELGLNLSEDELDSELKSFLQQQNISEDKLSELLRAEGETPDSHREEFRKQIETQRFIGRIIRPLVSVTDDQIRGYYLQQNADKEKSQLVRLRSLMLEIPSGLTSEELQTKKRSIETIRRDIDAGRPFTELVQIYSEAKDALKTKGELPPKAMNELPEKLRSRLKGKTPPLVVGPIELGSAVFFFEFLGTQLGDQKEYEKLRPQLESKLLDLKFRERLDEYLRSERLKVKVNRKSLRFYR